MLQVRTTPNQVRRLIQRLLRHFVGKDKWEDHPPYTSRTATEQDAHLLDLDVIDGIEYSLRNERPSPHEFREDS